MESCYTNGGDFMEELMGFREMENIYPNQAYINAINGCQSLDSYNNKGNSNVANFEANYNPNHLLALNRTNNNPIQSFVRPCFAPYGEDLSPPDFTADSSGSRNLDGQAYDSHFFVGEGGGPSPFSPIAGNENTEIGRPCKAEAKPELPSGERNSSGIAKKMSGQPSKNLMAERRRRKRLNDRLSMLRSVVPKISKMDRTSILGDTIDYMKELIERIYGLQKEMNLGSNQLSSITIFNNVKPNEIVVRNSPKFDVERRNSETRMEIWCGGKPELLVSTVTTLEALGLEIQQCVISCFNEFSLQASCSQELKKRAILDSQDIRQALLRMLDMGQNQIKEE